MIDLQDRLDSDFQWDGRPGSGSTNILLVDDDARNLDVLESILGCPEYRMVRAKSPDEALHALMSEEFALLVLDVRMPNMSGLELAHLVKQRKRTQNIPIIFMTAYYQEDEHILQGYDVGAVDYLSKPCNPGVLRSKVAVFVNLHRANQALRDEIVERKNAEQRVAERTKEVQRLVHQLRALATELMQTEQRERSRLSRILHDSIQQLIVTARLRLALLRRELKDARGQEHLQEVESTLKEALDISRSLTIELSPPVLHESGLAAGLRWLAARMADKNQFTVEVQCDEKIDENNEEERFLLFECARELLFNALKHAGTDSAKVYLARREDGRLELVVEDRGKGFDFNSLRGGNDEHSTFGLFSIQQRLTHLGGEIEIDSAPGKGTRITLTSPPTLKSELPAAIQSAWQIPVTPPSDALKSSSTIGVLIVDDHKIMRECLAGVLRYEPDIEILGEAENGAAAIEMADRLRPDVVIMDVNLGELSGIEVTKIILARNPRIRVIGLSLHVEESVSSALRQAGAVAFLTKGDASADLIVESIRATIRDRNASMLVGPTMV